MRRLAARIAALVSCILVVGGLVAGCGGGHASGETLVLYDGQHPQTTDALVTAFEHATGITVLVRNNDEAAFANQIAAEGAHSPADVFFAENSPALESLQERGLLAPVDASTLARVPSRFDSPREDWVGVSARVSVLVYNTRLVSRSALPTSVMQLAEPRFMGKLALAAGETDFQPIVTAVAEAHGQATALAWLQALKANAASHLYPNNETLLQDVNSGTATLGVIDQYYWFRLRAEIGASAMHSAIAFFSPSDPGYVLDVSGAAVLASSSHKQAAQRLLAFLVSAQGQQIIAQSGSFEYPLIAGIAPAGSQTPFSDLQPDPVSIVRLGDGAIAIALLQRAQLL